MSAMPGHSAGTESRGLPEASLSDMKSAGIKKALYGNLSVILFSVAAFMALVITIYTSVTIETSSTVFRENISERLLANSRAAAGLVTIDELERLQSPYDVERAFYGRIKARIIRFAGEAHVLYAYILRPVEGGRIQFIVDNEISDRSLSLKSPLSPMPAEVREAIESGMAVVSVPGIYEEGYSGLLTAYAPITNQAGVVVAVAGVDISDEQILDSGRRFRILAVMLLGSMAFIIASGLLSFFIYKRKEDVFSHRLKQQELMSRLAQSFISTEDIACLITGALETAGQFLHVTRVLVGRPEKNSRVSRPEYFWCAGGKIITFPEIAGFNELIETSFPAVKPQDELIPTLYVADAARIEKYSILGKIGVKAFIWVPLYVDGKRWAILSVEECLRPRAWTESDRSLVSLLASVIAGAVARDLREQERDAARIEAERASKAKSDFLANMSHEIRTPMNAIIGMTAIARNPSADLERKDYCLRKITDASTHLLGVINDILDMSKIEANKFVLSPIEFNFEKMLQKVVNVNNFRIDEKRQNFEVYLDHKIPPFLVGDDQRLTQVITNLLSNAAKFTPEQGIVRLKARLEAIEGQYCVLAIEVSDSGIGISEDQQKRLFASFEQADSSTSRKFGGTGLGLVISKQIVEMMGGNIGVRSELGKGATFFFTIRLEIAAHTEQDSMLAPGVNWKNLRVLVVDDSEDIRLYFEELASRLGFSCSVAGGAEEALRLIKEDRPFDIYFVDWKMPGMNGIELSSRIKEDRHTKSVVIMISTAEWASIEKEAREAGVDKFLPKPLFSSAIVDVINQCLGREALVAKQEGEEKQDHFENYRILLAEDVEINREIVISLLEPTGLEITSAENGAEAFNLYTKTPEAYDLIFMDVQMPEMDGYEATRRIRQFEKEYFAQTVSPEEAHKPVPIIAMTANVFREDVEKCLNAGMNDHVGKPLDIQEFMAKLRVYLKGEQ
jgi:signal transduction histidine kinase/DNA-binding response OmpR family regulator